MNEEVENLKQLALKATPGPWRVGKPGDGFRVVSAPTKLICKAYRKHPHAAKDGDRPIEGYDNAAFIAAAHPQAILALIEELEQANGKGG